MAELDIDASDVRRFAQRCLAAEPVVERHFGAAMVRSTAAVQHDAQVTVRVWQGHLRRSITTDVTPFLGRVGSNLPYARTEEEGWPARYAMPPEGALVPWMRAKNIPLEAENAIRWSMYIHGRKAHPYLIPALERNREGIEREFALAADRAIAEVLA